jgi:predicted  nucleic acid-binding Zn-ribbon protein
MSLPGQLYMLQQIDLELQRKQQELNEVENQLKDDKVLVNAESKFAWQKEQLAEARARQKSTEWELADLQDKINKINSKLYDGTTKNPKELVNLGNEVKSLKSKIGGKEDELLGLMSQAEDLEAKVKTSTEELKQLKQEWQQRQGTLEQRKTEVEPQLVELSRARHELTQQIGLEALRLYEQIRLAKEQAIAKVVQGRCQGCRITLPTSQWQKARAGDLIQCNSCNRILYLE